MTEKGLKRIEGVGEASVFRGDPRLPESDIDNWFNGMLGTLSTPKTRPYLWGADAGLCARRNVLLENNTWMPSEKTSANVAYMAIGVALEDMLAEGLRRNGKLINQSTKLVEMETLKISGKIDLIIEDYQGRLALVEVKSCGDLPAEPKPEHLAQIQTYAAVSGIHRCWLTYISRRVQVTFGPQCSMRSFLVDTNPDALTGRLRTAALSRLAGDLRRLPPVPATFRKHKECHYCEFRDHFCYGSRPGLGNTEPLLNPIDELDIQEHIDLDIKAGLIAEELYQESYYRKYRTLIALLGLEGLRVEHTELLEKEIRETLDKIE